jgi:hypothetical protein
MRPPELLARFAAADDNRKTEALQKLRAAAVDIATRETVDAAELRELDALLYSAGKSRNQLAADVARWCSIEELRRQVAAADEAALLKELADAGRDYDRILEAAGAVAAWNGSHADQRRWNEQSAAQVERQNDGRARIQRAQERVTDLRRWREKLAELEAAAAV